MILLPYDTARVPSLLPSLTAFDNQPIKLKELANNSLPLLPEKKEVSKLQPRNFQKKNPSTEAKEVEGANHHAP